MPRRSKSASDGPSQRQLRVGEDLRHHLASKVHLRRLPVLKFVADESYDTADRITRLFSSFQTDR